MANFPFPRIPRRGDPNAAIVVHKNLTDFVNEFLTPGQYYPPRVPRSDDPLKHLVVDKNMQEAVALLMGASATFYFPYAVRRNDPNAAIILQKNLEALVKAV
jgi:hypothetical protein